MTWLLFFGTLIGGVFVVLGSLKAKAAVVGADYVPSFAGDNQKAVGVLALPLGNDIMAVKHSAVALRGNFEMAGRGCSVAGNADDRQRLGNLDGLATADFVQKKP